MEWTPRGYCMQNENKIRSLSEFAFPKCIGERGINILGTWSPFGISAITKSKHHEQRMYDLHQPRLHKYKPRASNIVLNILSSNKVTKTKTKISLMI